MNANVRLKLIAIVGTAALALLVIIITSSLISRQVDNQLKGIREQYLPKVELGATLESQFEHLAKGFQDAVAAHDPDALDSTRELKNSFLKRLVAANRAVNPADIASLQSVVDEYYAAADDVSRRLIAGETGESIVALMTVMQAKQKRLAEVLNKTAKFDRADLDNTFVVIDEAQMTAGNLRLSISLTCLGLVVLLSWWLGRDVMRSIAALTTGFERFGRGDFAQPIAIISHDELGEVARQANKMADSLKTTLVKLEATLLQTQEQKTRVQEASRMKSEFLANMSHELRTPLNAIIGFAELLHDDEVKPEMPQFKEFLGDILISGRHLLQLINDVLDLSKVEAGKVEFHPEEVDLSALVSEVLAILRATAAAKGVRIEQRIDASVIGVEIDAARLKQVLYNYVSNALKFSERGGQVTVRVEPEGPSHFRLEVEDSGIGISESDLTRLFIEFQQLDAGAAKRHSGTGLGLALTKKLVEAQFGTVGARSTVGKGSIFHAILPRRSEVGGAKVLPRSIPGAHPRAASVLVVEDNERDQESVVRALSGAGYAVETATTGEQALAKCRERTFDAITLDLILPDVGGLQVLRTLRQSDRHQDVPVIVITVVTEEGAMTGFAVHDILSKPLDDATLLQSLQRAGVLPASSGDILIVDDNGGSRRLMSAAITQLGFKATCAANGESGLQLANEAAPRAVVLDLLMPGMDGFAFLELFRQAPGCSQVPVIIWTAKDLTRADYSRLQMSAQGIVTKGQGASTIAEELRVFLSAKSEQRT